jgi:rare lipoprotein A
MKILIICTFYAMSFQGKLTSSGTRFSQSEYTCATRLYPLGSVLRVSSKGRSVVVKVSDRCRSYKTIDLSRIAFSKIGDLKQGKLNVKIERI